MLSDNDSDDDLPSLPSIFAPTKYTKYSLAQRKKKKSIQDRVKEQINLAQTFQEENVFQNHIEEKLKNIKIINSQPEEPEPDLSPSSTMEEFKIFCVSDSLQFFNSRDVTPALCGYNERSELLTSFEKDMLTYIRAELQNVLSSFLLTCHPCCISDCKSFIIFLLQNISISNDAASVVACYQTLITMLSEHPLAKHIAFGSSELFMILFNYGIDVENCQLLKWRPGIKKCLSTPTFQSKSFNKIPDNWTYNCEFMLRSFTKLVSTCIINGEDLCNVVLFIIWMGFDSTLHSSNLYPILQECISACVERIPDNSNSLSEILTTVISLDVTDTNEKWDIVYKLADSIPNTTLKSCLLKKQIGFLALNRICFGNKEDILSEVKCTIQELQLFLPQLINIECETLLFFAAKFIDLCTCHVDADIEECNQACADLKQIENSLPQNAHMTKSHLCKVHARLKRRAFQSVMYKLPSFQRCDVYNPIKVKKEINSSPERDSYQNVYIKQEIKDDFFEKTSDRSFKIGSMKIKMKLVENDQGLYPLDNPLKQEAFNSNENPKEIKVTGVFSGNVGSTLYGSDTQSANSEFLLQSSSDNERSLKAEQESENDTLCITSTSLGDLLVKNIKSEPGIDDIATDEFSPCGIIVSSVTSCADAEQPQNQLESEENSLPTSNISSPVPMPKIISVESQAEDNVNLTATNNSPSVGFNGEAGISESEPNLHSFHNLYDQPSSIDDPIRNLFISSSNFGDGGTDLDAKGASHEAYSFVNKILMDIENPDIVDSCSSFDASYSQTLLNKTASVNATNDTGDEIVIVGEIKSPKKSKTNKNVNPTIKNVNPTTSENVNPTTFQNVNSTTSENVNPTTFKSVLPTAFKNVNSTTLENVNPTTYKSTNPTAFKNVSPTTLENINPTAFKNVNSTTLENVNPTAFKDMNSTTFKNVNPTTIKSENTTVFKNVNSTTLENVNPATLKNVNPTTFKSVNPTTFKSTNSTTFRGANSATFKGVNPTAFKNVNPTPTKIMNPTSTKIVNQNTSKNVDAQPEVIFLEQNSKPTRLDKRLSITISPNTSSKKIIDKTKSSSRLVEDEITIVRNGETSCKKTVPQLTSKKPSKTVYATERTAPNVKDSTHKLKHLFPLSKDVVILEIPAKNAQSSKKPPKTAPEIEELYKRKGLSITSIKDTKEIEDEEQDEIMVVKEVTPLNTKKRRKKTRDRTDDSLFMRQSMVLEDPEDSKIVVDAQALLVLNAVLADVEEVFQPCSENESVSEPLFPKNIPGLECVLVTSEEKLSKSNMVDRSLNLPESFHDSEDSTDRLISSGAVIETLVQEVSLKEHLDTNTLLNAEKLVAAGTVLENLVQEVSFHVYNDTDYGLSDRLTTVKTILDNLIQDVLVENADTNIDNDISSKVTDVNPVLENLVQEVSFHDFDSNLSKEISSRLLAVDAFLDNLIKEVSLDSPGHSVNLMSNLNKFDTTGAIPEIFRHFEISIDTEVSDVLENVVASVVDMTNLQTLGNFEEQFFKTSDIRSHAEDRNESVMHAEEVNKENSFYSASEINSLTHNEEKKIFISNKKSCGKKKSPTVVHVKKRSMPKQPPGSIPLNSAKVHNSISELLIPSPKHNLFNKQLTCKKTLRQENSNAQESNLDADRLRYSSMSVPKPDLKRKNTEFQNSIPKVKRFSSPQKSNASSNKQLKHFKYKPYPSKLYPSPKKPNLITRNIYSSKKRTSPFIHALRVSQKKPLKWNEKNESILSQTGLALPQLLREKLLSSPSNSKSSSSSGDKDNPINVDSDSDIEILYPDFSDSDCVIIYEKEVIHILD